MEAGYLSSPLRAAPDDPERISSLLRPALDSHNGKRTLSDSVSIESTQQSTESGPAAETGMRDIDRLLGATRNIRDSEQACENSQAPQGMSTRSLLADVSIKREIAQLQRLLSLENSRMAIELEKEGLQEILDVNQAQTLRPNGDINRLNAGPEVSQRELAELLLHLTAQLKAGNMETQKSADADPISPSVLQDARHRSLTPLGHRVRRGRLADADPLAPSALQDARKRTLTPQGQSVRPSDAQRDNPRQQQHPPCLAKPRPDARQSRGTPSTASTSPPPRGVTVSAEPRHPGELEVTRSYPAPVGPSRYGTIKIAQESCCEDSSGSKAACQHVSGKYLGASEKLYMISQEDRSVTIWCSDCDNFPRQRGFIDDDRLVMQFGSGTYKDGQIHWSDGQLWTQVSMAPATPVQQYRSSQSPPPGIRLTGEATRLNSVVAVASSQVRLSRSPVPMAASSPGNVSRACLNIGQYPRQAGTGSA